MIISDKCVVTDLWYNINSQSVRHFAPNTYLGYPFPFFFLNEISIEYSSKCKLHVNDQKDTILRNRIATYYWADNSSVRKKWYWPRLAQPQTKSGPVSCLYSSFLTEQHIQFLFCYFLLVHLQYKILEKLQTKIYSGVFSMKTISFQYLLPL